MSESQTPIGVIPYVDHHVGPKRVLTVDLVPPAGTLSGLTTSQIKPNLFIDGRQYIVYWGRIHLEAPADRAVHLGVGMQDGLRGASVLLPAAAEPITLLYKVPRMGEVYFGPAFTAPPD